MKKNNKINVQSINKISLIKSIGIGTGIAFISILFFITGAESQPDWPEFWKIRPLIITPLAGAFGGGFFYLSNHLLRQAGFNKIIAVIISSIGFIIVLWLGIVLGLDGTLWD